MYRLRSIQSSGCRSRTWPWFPVLRLGAVQLGAFQQHLLQATGLRAVRVFFGLDLGVVLAVDGHETPWSPCRCPARARSGRNARESGPDSSARCDCARCRKMVTPMMVRCVVTSVYRTICHQGDVPQAVGQPVNGRVQHSPVGINMEKVSFKQRTTSGGTVFWFASILSRPLLYKLWITRTGCNLRQHARSAPVQRQSRVHAAAKTIGRMPVRPQPQVTGARFAAAAQTGRARHLERAQASPTTSGVNSRLGGEASAMPSFSGSRLQVA